MRALERKWREAEEKRRGSQGKWRKFDEMSVCEKDLKFLREN